MRNKKQTKPRRGPLEGVRILDLCFAHLAGPFASMILADLGAEVIRIEPPGGRASDVAGAPPMFKGESVYFLAFNRNKKSIVLDLKSQRGKEIFHKLTLKSDVVLDNFRRGVTERLSVDYNTLKKINPRIICCSITGFGDTGPYKNRISFDLIAQAMGGGMSITGEPGRPPCRAGLPIGDGLAGLFATIGIVAALYAREHTKLGQRVDIALLDSQIALLSYIAAYYLVAGQLPGPQGSGHPTNPVYRACKTKDGYIAIGAQGPFFTPLCKTLGIGELADDPRFDSESKRLRNKRQLWTLLERIFITKTTSKWEKILVKAGIAAGPVNSVDKALTDPQVRYRKMVITLHHPAGGRIKLAGNPIKMSEASDEFFSYPPAYGQHTDEVLAQLLGPSKLRRSKHSRSRNS